MNRKMLIIVPLFILVSSSLAFSGTFSTNKWSKAPRDIYFHVGGSMTCTSLIGLSFKHKSIKSGRIDDNRLKFESSWKSLVICNALGLIKEFGFDNKPSLRESLFNFAGSILGVGIIYTW